MSWDNQDFDKFMKGLSEIESQEKQRKWAQDYEALRKFIDKYPSQAQATPGPLTAPKKKKLKPAKWYTPTSSDVGDFVIGGVVLLLINTIWFLPFLVAKLLHIDPIATTAVTLNAVFTFFSMQLVGRELMKRRTAHYKRVMSSLGGDPFTDDDWSQAKASAMGKVYAKK